jgi:hypothetical protein
MKVLINNFNSKKQFPTLNIYVVIWSSSYTHPFLAWCLIKHEEFTFRLHITETKHLQRSTEHGAGHLTRMRDRSARTADVTCMRGRFDCIADRAKTLQRRPDLFTLMFAPLGGTEANGEKKQKKKPINGFSLLDGTLARAFVGSGGEHKSQLVKPTWRTEAWTSWE